MLGYFNNWDIIHFAHETTSSDKIDKIHQVLLDDISENMSVLVKMANTVPLPQQIKPLWVTMLLNYFWKPTHYKKTQLATEKLVHMMN